MRLIINSRQMIIRAGWLLAAVALIAGGCGNDDSAESGDVPTVIATTSIWADVVANVACDGLAEVSTIIPPGGDPHAFQPSLSDRGRMENAALIVANGLFLEEGLGDTIDAVEEAGTPVFRMTDHVSIIEFGSAMGHDDHDEDDHDDHDEEEGHDHDEEEGHDHDTTRKRATTTTRKRATTTTRKRATTTTRKRATTTTRKRATTTTRTTTTRTTTTTTTKKRATTTTTRKRATTTTRKRATTTTTTTTTTTKKRATTTTTMRTRTAVKTPTCGSIPFELPMRCPRSAKLWPPKLA